MSNASEVGIIFLAKAFGSETVKRNPRRSPTYWNPCGAVRETRNVGYLALFELGQQTQDFDVQPYQGDHQAKGADPFHVFGQALLRTLFNDRKVDHQVEGG
jgi:hypothetical protein